MRTFFLVTISMLITLTLLGQQKAENRFRECLQADSLFEKNLDNENLNCMHIFLPDSAIHFTANIRKDHRFFGYAKPDLNSEKLILYSIFTMDVQNNPYCCKLGAYYDIWGEYPKLTFKARVGSFAEVELIDSLENSYTLYFKEKWICFH